MEQKLKQRICIEICVKLQISATETFKMPNKAFPNDPPKRTTMILGKNAQNVQKITDLIKENPRTTLLELEQDTGISKTTIGRIVTKDLKLKKTPAKYIPRFLTNEQKLYRLATCENMLEMTRTDPEWKDKIITGYETWVYDYDPETKRQYAEWRGQGEPRPKKSRILKSRNKVLLVAFLDNKGIVHHEYLPAGQTVIKEMYLDILRHLREAIRKKMPEKWPNEILPQPPYSPDIAPNDFFLFPKLKAVLKGRHFDTRDDIIEKSLLALKSIPKELYKNCFDNLGKRWRWQERRTSSTTQQLSQARKTDVKCNTAALPGKKEGCQAGKPDVKCNTRRCPKEERMATTANPYHWLEMNIKMKMAKMGRPTHVTRLNDEMAVELGSELLGEFIIFGTAAATLIYEYKRNAAKERAKEQACLQRIEDLHVGLHKLIETVQEQQKLLDLLQQEKTAQTPSKQQLP
ncbi:hypothetical protein LAZ67_6003358 [Cordylochernes scorpioides]|uniref:Transposase n=1 Tax=Cordylochernes scorpioides TaxID=51811 RepID=A0ABY6KMF7_9ARAC|nr:hypothetical protein LAZ67_6003358 [Cordylochernes scorpioides]